MAPEQPVKSIDVMFTTVATVTDSDDLLRVDFHLFRMTAKIRFIAPQPPMPLRRPFRVPRLLSVGCCSSHLLCSTLRCAALLQPLQRPLLLPRRTVNSYLQS